MINLDLIKQHWRELLIGVLFLLLICIGVYEYNKHQALPMATIQSVAPTEITKAFSGLRIQATPALVKDTVQTIERRVQSPPDIVYVTQTQAQADKQADKVGKQDKADALIKEPKDNITNNYYGIKLEKNNKVKVGLTLVDGKIYENIGYQHKKTEVIVHMQPGPQPIKGFTAMQTIAEW